MKDPEKRETTHPETQVEKKGQRYHEIVGNLCLFLYSIVWPKLSSHIFYSLKKIISKNVCSEKKIQAFKNDQNRKVQPPRNLTDYSWKKS